MKNILVLSLFFLFIHSSLHAFTRTANTSGAFNLTATWGGDPVPVNGDDVIINTGISVTLVADFTTSGSLTMNGTGTLQMAGFSFNVGSLAAAGAAVINNAGAAKEFNCGVSNASTTYSGTFTNNVQLVKRGTGTLTLSANSSLLYMDIQNGTLAVTGGTQTLNGNMSNNRALNVAGGTLNLSGGRITSPSRAFVFGYAGASTVSTISGGARLDAAELIVGWDANATVTFTTSTGAITHSFGTHIIHKGSGEGILNFTPTLNSVQLSTALVRNDSDGTGTDGLTVLISTGNLRTASVGMNSTQASGTHYTNIILDGGTITATASGDLFTLPAGGGTGQTSTLTLNSGGATIVANTTSNIRVPIVTGTAGGNLTLSSAGATVFFAANTYTQRTDLTGANTILRLGASGVIADAAQINFIGANATLDMNGFSETLGTITGNGNAGIIDNVSAGGNVTLTAGGTNGNFNFQGRIINSTGTLSLTKVGTGVLTLSGTPINTYDGTTTISAGSIRINKATALGSAVGSTIISNNAALDLNGITYANAEPLSIVGTGVSSGGVIFNGVGTAATFPGPITLTGNATITVGNQITLSGNITPNTLDLTKNGASSLVFTSNTVSVRDFTIGAGTLNAGTSTINISRTFTNSGTFTCGTGTVAFVGTSAQVIPAFTYYNLTLNNSAAAASSIAGNISIPGTISLLDGVLATGAFRIDLGANGSISEVTPNAFAPTSYVTGNVRATRDIGSGTVTFGGIGLDITETTIPGNSTVVTRTTGTSRTYTVGGNTYYSIERYFDITPANDVNLNGTMVFHYFDHELHTSVEANLKIYKDSTTGYVLKKASTVNTASNTLTLSGIKDFSLWTASDYIFEPLPITLVRFVAEQNTENGNVDLKWTTVSEIDNDYFSLEKSYDGVVWEVFGEVDGAGTSTKVLNYTFEDPNTARGVVYYRLKQTDFDGTFENSKIIAFELNSPVNSSTECTLYPMPSSVDNISLLLITKDFGNYNLSICNSQGIVLMDKSFDQSVETDLIDLSNQLNDDINEGLYIMRLTKDEIPVCTSKFILE